VKGSGHAVCLGADIDTDVIIAGRYLRTKDRSVWAARVLEDLDPGLAPRLAGAVIVAGKNFGCGSSREQAPVALKEAGVVAVIAPSFARIFYRNAINVGLPVIEAEGLDCADGDEVSFDITGGWVACGEKRVHARKISPRMVEILHAGGLVPHRRARK
jgi:methanogen homoaconitase small subunit